MTNLESSLSLFDSDERESNLRSPVFHHLGDVLTVLIRDTLEEIGSTSVTVQVAFQVGGANARGDQLREKLERGSQRGNSHSLEEDILTDKVAQHV